MPARWARHHLVIPVHDEISLVEACTVAGLPTGIIGYGTDDGHAILTLAVDENMLEKIHTSLKMRDLLPSEHLVNAGTNRCSRAVDK